jgi:hypothetical protein
MVIASGLVDEGKSDDSRYDTYDYLLAENLSNTKAIYDLVIALEPGRREVCHLVN